MKFGKQLESLSLTKFKGYYVQYKELKKAIKVFTGHEKNQSTVQEVTHWTSSFLRSGPNPEVPPEARLQEILDRELERVSKFADLEDKGLRKQLERLAEECRNGSETCEELRRKLDELGDSIVQLRSFAQLNFSGFRKLLKKYDKWSRSNVTPWFMPQVVRSSIISVDYDGLIKMVSEIATELRKREQAATIDEPLAPMGREPSSELIPPASELVFLVDAKDSVRVKVEIAKALSFTRPLALLAETSPGAPSTRKRTVATFFDTQDLAVYAAHIARASTSTAAAMQPTPQLRDVRPSPCASVHVRHCGGDSVRLAFKAAGEAARTEVALTYKEARVFLPTEPAAAKKANQETFGAVGTPAPLGAVEPATGEAAESALAAAQRTLQQQGGMRPVAQVSYVRSVFGDCAGIVAVLDEDVRLAPSTTFDAVAAASTESFPYDVLSVTFPAEAQAIEAPRWLRGIYNSANVFQVPGFSKAEHAVAHFEARANGMLLPHWYQSIMSSEVVKEDPSKEPSETDSQQQGENASVPGQSGGGERQQVTPAPPVGMSGPAWRLVHEFGSTQDTCGASIVRAGAGTEFPAPAVPGVGNDLREPLLSPGAGTPAAANVCSPAAPTRGGFLARLVRRGQKQPVEASEELPVRTAIVAVQPKTLYSNERTFLEWVHFSTVFAALGLAGLHAATTVGEVALARFIVIVAVSIVVWALHTFNWRAEALEGKEIRDYEDHVGPIVLVAGLMISLTCASLHGVGLMNFANGDPISQR